MRVFTKPGVLTAALAAGITAAGTFAASATVIDFTASSSASGSIGSVGWSLTPSAGDTLTFVDSDAPGPIGVLAGLNDGVGLNNDEITEGTQYLTVTFTKPIRLTGFWTLDLFEDGLEDTDPETAQLFTGSTPTGSPAASLPATEVFAPGGFGFSFAGTSLLGDTFTFAATSGNDGVGKGDYALAGLQIAAIPLPAAGLLFGTALMGFGMFRRR